MKTTRKWREAAIFWSFSRLIRRNMVWKRRIGIRHASTPYFFESAFLEVKMKKDKVEAPFFADLKMLAAGVEGPKSVISTKKNGGFIK